MTRLVLELLTEELPPKSLLGLSDFFAQKIFAGLLAQGFLAKESALLPIATPRRLGLVIDAVRSTSPTQSVTEKVLPVSLAFDSAGQATPVLEKKIAALCAQFQIRFSAADCIRKQEGKTESLFYSFNRPGISLEIALQKLVTDTLATLPIAKMMQYQLPNSQSVTFVRPAHRLLALHGNRVLPLSALGLTADRFTEGHRFLSVQSPVEVKDADSYLGTLRASFVEPLWAQRYSQIETQLNQVALQINPASVVIKPKELLEEVCALVEWPAVYPCSFDPAFLRVPQECLILTMQQNQKYFVLQDQDGYLLPHFLIVSNIETAKPAQIISGNEKVVRPRLADAAFFYQQDQKISLETRQQNLSKTIYHQKLGTQAQRTTRITNITQALVQTSASTVPPLLLTRAAAFCKTDLQTEMVAEFPELQGTMGGYYARLAGEDEAVAKAISEHYFPRFATDALPATSIGTLLSLADKLEALVGFWGVGMRATGEKDPFALRRLALAICRLLIEKQLSFTFEALLTVSVPAFTELANFTCDRPSLILFLSERLRSFLKEQQFSPPFIDATVVLQAAPASIPARIQSVVAFINTAEAPSLIAAHKRINNILTKSVSQENSVNNFVDKTLFELPIESALWVAYETIAPPYYTAIKNEEFLAALLLLKELSPLIDSFFTEVMVFDSDPAKQQNRIALLTHLRQLLNGVADFSLLSL